MKIGILILNYLAYEETIECVNSIKLQSYKDWEIIIVDNASNNNSYDILRKEYLNEKDITVLKTEKNLGFAKGNNFGLYEFSKKNIYKVLVINGDTEMNDINYLQKLSKIEYSKNIGMIGTKIKTKGGLNQNPLPVNLTNKKKIWQNRIELITLIFLVYSNLFNLIKLLKKKSKHVLSSNIIVNNKESKILDPNQEMLHGSAILFTENYLNLYIGFYPETFLYYEEEFLALICRKLNFYQMYVPYLEIYHKEDSSSDLLYSNKLKSLKFKLKIIRKNISLYRKVFCFSREKIVEEMQK